jgi:hypothetical protein
MLTVVFGLPAIFILSYLVLKPYFPAWSLRGFERFENKWPQIFFTSGCIAVAVALLAWWRSDYNVTLGLIVGLLAGFFFIAAWTDAQTHKAPAELSGLTIAVLAVAALVGIVTNVQMPKVYNGDFFPRVPVDNWTQFAGILVAVMLIGILGFIKIGQLSIAYICLFASYIAFFVLVYSGISWVFVNSTNYDLQNIGYKLFALWAVLGLVLLLDIFVGADKFGRADIKALYAITFAAAWWMSAYMTWMVILAGFFMQAILHVVAKPLNIGTTAEVAVTSLHKLWWKIKSIFNKKYREIEMPTHYVAWRVPFLPVLAITAVIGILILI